MDGCRLGRESFSLRLLHVPLGHGDARLEISGLRSEALHTSRVCSSYILFLYKLAG